LFTRSILPLDKPYTESAHARWINIKSKEQCEWGHCGKENSPIGTEGSFEVHQEDGEKIAEIYWNGLYGADNKLEKRYVKPDYDISFDGFSISKGPLGKGTINVRVD
jgi:hypothetical protein